MKSKIPGGFILKARCIQQSEISHATPCTREVWDWLLMNAAHTDTKNIKRGQLFIRYKEIIDGLSWKVGFRKMSYTNKQLETAMKTLRTMGMIVTTKVVMGVFITICNYDKYQDMRCYAGSYVGGGEGGKNHLKEKKKKEEIKPKDEILDYLKTKITDYGYTEIEDKIIEFFKYRQAMPKRDRYKSEKGINGLFRHIKDLKDSGLNIFACLEMTMEEGWKTPNPDYFKNKNVGNQTQVIDAASEFIQIQRGLEASNGR